jgi:cellulose synthase/poly-beta-1,6-N-acetylglucosamine synthase-like glycosyltransferase
LSPIALPLLYALAIPAAGSSLYLLLLTMLSAKARPFPASSRLLRFDVVIPAHNEASGIEAVIHSVRAVDWPADRFRVVVVADNCTDATAQIAEASGAQVLVRHDAIQRGKGYALAYAFAESRERRWADAVVVVDADSCVTTNLLEAIAARMERGEEAVQVHYGVTNTHASWRTRLMAIAMGAFHGVRSRARARLGLSCGVRGNGWAVTNELLERVPYASFSLTEDLEFGIELGMHGVRVAYAGEASCDGEMVSGGANARSQRRRWEQGRIALLGRAMPLLKQAAAARSLLCLDLALDLLVPPISYIALMDVALLTIAWLPDPGQALHSGWWWTGLLSSAALTLYVMRGWQLSGTGMRGLLDLLRAPFFLAWKVLVMLGARRSAEWVRTKREGS